MLNKHMSTQLNICYLILTNFDILVIKIATFLFIWHLGEPSFGNSVGMQTDPWKLEFLCAEKSQKGSEV